MSGRQTWIVLFRGVGGKTQLPVARLREELTAAGFEKAATYINSGNALVVSDLPHDMVIATIAEVTARAFDFHKEIYAVTPKAWRAMMEANPFQVAEGKGNTVHMALLASTPAPQSVQKIRDFAFGGEAIEVVGNAAYILTPNGFGTSKLAERFDKLIGVPNTARNWNSVTKLLELAEAM